MALPSSLNAVTVTAAITDASGSALAAIVTFTPVAVLSAGASPVPVTVTDSAGMLIIGSAGVRRSTGVTGSLSVKLAATDNADLSPAGFAYQITTQLAGYGAPQSFVTLLPSSPATVDLSELLPAVVAEALYPYASASALTAETTRAGAAEAAAASALSAEVTRAEAAEALAVPKTQTLPGAVPDQYTTPLLFHPSGTTDSLAAFADMFIGQTYGTSPAVLETAWSSGYNPWSLLTPGEAAMFTTIHPDAGDTNVAGAHGIEWMVTFHDTAGHEVNAIEVLGVRDSSTSCGMTLRCGTGGEGPAGGITFQNSTGAITYFLMGPVVLNQIWAYAPIVTQGVSLVVGNGALATNATSGFLYLPTCAGAPTGTPGAHTGTAACVYDSADNRLYVYNGAWKSVALA